jgi:hypothetical protein
MDQQVLKVQQELRVHRVQMDQTVQQDRKVQLELLVQQVQPVQLEQQAHKALQVVEVLVVEFLQ